MSPALVEGGDLDGRASKIVGQKRNHAAFVAPDLDASRQYRQSRIALVREFDLVIGDALPGTLESAKVSQVRCTVVGEQAVPLISELPPPGLF